ncbi:hypothetical protein TRVA0_007S01200 [Trichomonascus vanleenenianus]|uniref:palmitoyl-CoA hydrolase n=1 Tax=Trichomonascus vanleenenianus TaxID=2268995 RepID=UPI003ECA70FD
MTEKIEEPVLADPPNKTFADLMSLKEIPVPVKESAFAETTRYFQSTVRPFRPLNAPGVFGGHVLAQCAVAGARTVGSKYIIHNLHGYFILPGKQDVPFTYKVETIRNGRSYSVRQIRVYQPPLELGPIEEFDFGSKHLCFIGILSFKEPEESILDHQHPMHPSFHPESLPHSVHEVPLAPEVDMPQWEAWVADPDNTYVQEVHPIEVRKLKMDHFNKDISEVSKRRQLHYFKSHDPLPSDPNLHIAAFLYASDRNSLFTIINLQDNPHDKLIKRIASIDHAFVMHNLDARADDGWLTMETFSDRSFDGRGLYNGRIYDKNKRLVCSFMQDGVVRLYKDEEKHKAKPRL